MEASKMKSLNDIVAENIRKRREAMGLTKRALAKELGTDVSGSNFTYWERGERLPDAYSLCLLADALGCSVDELLGRK